MHWWKQEWYYTRCTYCNTLWIFKNYWKIFLKTPHDIRREILKSSSNYMEKSEKRCMIYYTLFSVLHFSLKNIEQHYSLKKSACSIFKLPLSDIFKNCTPVSRTRWVQFAFLYNNYLILQPHYNGQSLLVSSKDQKNLFSRTIKNR